MRGTLVALVGLLVAMPGGSTPDAQRRPAGSAAQASQSLALLAPTAHPQVPSDLSLLWLAPATAGGPARSSAAAAIGAAARLTAEGDYKQALTLTARPATTQGTLGNYAAFYAGVAQLRLNRAADAVATFRALQAQRPVGYLWEAAQLGEAEAQEALDEPSSAVVIYERLLKGRLTDVEDVYMRLGRAAKAAGDPTKTAEAFAHVYYEFPLGQNAARAKAELDELDALLPLTPSSIRYDADLGRAERLFGAKRYADARSVFQDLSGVATGDAASLVALRLAEIDYFTKRTRPARDALKELAAGTANRAEAMFHFALAARASGDADTFVRIAGQVAADFPGEPWAEQALDSLATYFIRIDEDDRADATFRQLLERFPSGEFAERAAWKVGWTAYRKAAYADAATTFERGAATFPRSDFRPAWIYWAGRAHDNLGATAAAQQRYALAATDYANSYYGRLALKRMDPATAARVATARTPVNEAAPASWTLPPNAETVRALLAADLFDEATKELRYAQRVWGDSAAIQATLAWTIQQQARDESGMRRLQMLRAGMNTMRRAYPQFMANGGDGLPREVLTVIFPLSYWDLIRSNAEANGLDPYFVAALVAQESTFVADVKSSAKAVGLMQLMPATGRMYARKLNLKYSARLLTDPEANIRMGTAYLADKIKEFGDAHLALASYNAGERAVRRWKDERPGLDDDEFIDDIPYPETQGYVKKILGTAEDYRHIYGSQAAKSADTIAPPSRVAAPASPAPAARKPAAKPKPKAAPSRPAPRKPAARKPAAR